MLPASTLAKGLLQFAFASVTGDSQLEALVRIRKNLFYQTMALPLLPLVSMFMEAKPEQRERRALLYLPGSVANMWLLSSEAGDFVMLF